MDLLVLVPQTLERADRKTEPTRVPPAFGPVDVTPPATASVIEVVFRGGERLQIAADASPALVQMVLTTLRTAC